MTTRTLTITDAGRARLPSEGGTAAITIVEAGITATAFLVSPTLTALPGEIKRVATIAGAALNDTSVHLTIRDSSSDAYDCRGIGLYLDDGTLFAVDGDDDPICCKVPASHFFVAADIAFETGDAPYIQFGNTDFLNPPATETEKGVAYLATVVEALAGAVADKIITPATMAAVLANYVAADQLGVPNGVATLGADGKLLLAQRPPIDLIDVFAVANQAAMLALAATPGDFAVRADNGLVFVLQTAPATTLGNWIEISTPAPVSSVNGKVGTVVLTPADIGSPPNARTVNAGGLATGGGDMSANRTISVAIASAAEALAGIMNNKAVTPAALADLIALVNGKAGGGTTINGGGLATGGGDLSANRTITVAGADAAETLAGVISNKAVTPAALAGLPKALTPNGYARLPGGLIVQWIQYRAVFTSELAIWIPYPIVFPNETLLVQASGVIYGASIFRDLWPQPVYPYEPSGVTIQLQGDDPTDRRLDGIDILVFGW